MEPTPLHLSLWSVMSGHLNVQAILGQSGKTEAKSHYGSVSEPRQGLRAPASQLWRLPHCRNLELPSPSAIYLWQPQPPASMRSL